MELKQIKKTSPFRNEDDFNRTIVELKLLFSLILAFRPRNFNRTIVELKRIFAIFNETALAYFNRTIVELKQLKESVELLADIAF